jgi:hypothetical protein
VKTIIAGIEVIDIIDEIEKIDACIITVRMAFLRSLFLPQSGLFVLERGQAIADGADSYWQADGKTRFHRCLTIDSSSGQSPSPFKAFLSSFFFFSFLFN